MRVTSYDGKVVRSEAFGVRGKAGTMGIGDRRFSTLRYAASCYSGQACSNGRE